MSIVATVYRQFHKPTRFLGRVAGWIMANRPSNIERNRWTVDLLNVQPSDHVLEIGFGPDWRSHMPLALRQQDVSSASITRR